MTRSNEMRTVCRAIDTVIESKGAHSTYIVMTDDYFKSFRFPQLLHDTRDNRLLVGDEYIVITCANGYAYYVNITMDSAIAACA